MAQFANHLGMRAYSEVGLNPRLQRSQTLLLQASDFCGREGLNAKSASGGPRHNASASPVISDVITVARRSTAAAASGCRRLTRGGLLRPTAQTVRRPARREAPASNNRPEWSSRCRPPQAPCANRETCKCTV